MGVYDPTERPPPKASPKRWSLPANFHTESQNAAHNAVGQQRLKRAVAPLRPAPPINPPRNRQTQQAQQKQQTKQVVSSWRKHIRKVINTAVDAHGPRGVEIAATLLQHEANQTHDQLRLRSRALDRSVPTSQRLSAARELRVRYGLPVTTAQLQTPERLKRVAAFLKETDQHIARDSGGPAAVNLATATLNPLHTMRFIHTLGALSSAGAEKVVGALGTGTDASITGKIDLTPKILKKIGTNATKDLLDLPAQTVVSAADIGSALAAAHSGNYAPLKQIAKSTEHLLAHPTEHPLAAALVFKGGVGALDRAAGAAVRTATLGKVAGTGGRAPIELYGKQAIERSRATGLAANITQRILDHTRPGAVLYNKFAYPVREARRELAAAENYRARRAQPTEDLRHVADRVAAARQKLEGRMIGKNEALPVVRDYHLGKRVDEAVDTANALRSAAVIKGRKELRASLPRQLRSALRPVIEGTIKSPESAVADIHAELERLQKEHDAMQAAEEPRWKVRRNEAQQHTFERLLENKHFLENPHPVFDAADKFIETQREMEAKLHEHGLLDPERALRSKLIPFAVREMGARYDPRSDRIVAANGDPLSTSDMAAAAHEAGIRRLGFVSQRGDLGRLGDYFKDPTRQPSGYFQKRTGESAMQGLHSLHFKMVDAQMAHTLNVLAQAEHANEILDRFGVKPKGDMAFTDHVAAGNAAQEMSDKTGMRWEPVKIGAAVGEQLKAVHNHIDPASAAILPDHGQLPGNPKYLVMPSVVAERFREHANSLGSNSFQLGWQALTHQFRNTVLPLSPRWLAGNVVELAVRGAIAGTGPLAWGTGHLLFHRLKLLDEGAYDHLVARGTPGANYASQVRLDRYHGIERYVNKGLAEHFAKYAYGFLHHPLSPGHYTVAPAAWLYSKYAHAIKVITPVVEKEFQKAAIGKAALHELRDMHGSWLAAMPHWSGAIDDVAHGLLNTNKQLKFAEYVDKVVGRYNKLSPAVRNLVAGYAPFALWYVNAAKFVFATMPKDHPVLQGLIAAGYADSEKERLARESSVSYGTKHTEPFLQGTLPEGHGHNLALNRYMPWGAFQDPENWQSVFVPQLNGLISLAGVNWKFKELKGPPGTDMGSAQERIFIALNSVAESLLPGLAVARRLREQGGSAYDNSFAWSPKVRPGTKHGYLGRNGSLRKVWDPLKSYAPGKPPSSASAPKIRVPSLGGGSTRSGPKLGTGSSPSGVRLG